MEFMNKVAKYLYKLYLDYAILLEFTEDSHLMRLNIFWLQIHIDDEERGFFLHSSFFEIFVANLSSLSETYQVKSSVYIVHQYTNQTINMLKSK